MEIDLHGTLLYEAATNSLAADASSENCWSKMVQCSTEPEFKANLKQIEKQIKAEYKLTSMPNAWRSAKSVVLGALAENINLYDDNNNVRGKTEIQNQLKVFSRPKEFLDKKETDLAMQIFRPFHRKLMGCSKEVQKIICEHMKITYDILYPKC